MFGRKNKYYEVVAKARDYAKRVNQTYVVFQHTDTGEFDYQMEHTFQLMIKIEPLVKLLICLPDGTVAQ